VVYVSKKNENNGTLVSILSTLNHIFQYCLNEMFLGEFEMGDRRI
jgi:hypothetical protein